jgi:hypothetical protein
MRGRTRPFRLSTAIALLAVAVTVGPAGAAGRDHSGVEVIAAPDGVRLDIDSASVDVRLSTGDVEAVEVATVLHISGVGEERAESYISNHLPRVEVGDGRIAIAIAPGRMGFLGLGTFTARASLALLVPLHVQPDITTSGGEISVHGDLANARPLYLRSTTGDMELVGAAAALDIRSASGSARLELIRPTDRLFARTSSGDITLAGGAREAHADTASGSVSLANLSGNAEVITSTGAITLAWDRLSPAHRVVVRSDSGRIHLTLPEGVSPRGRLTSIGGRIRSDFPGLVNDAGDEIALSGDGPELLVDSASGDILLEAGAWWDDAADDPG